jgi:hypothetical protein
VQLGQTPCVIEYTFTNQLCFLPGLVENDLYQIDYFLFSKFFSLLLDSSIIETALFFGQ